MSLLYGFFMHTYLLRMSLLKFMLLVLLCAGDPTSIEVKHAVNEDNRVIKRLKLTHPSEQHSRSDALEGVNHVDKGISVKTLPKDNMGHIQSQLVASTYEDRKDSELLQKCDDWDSAERHPENGVRDMDSDEAQKSSNWIVKDDMPVLDEPSSSVVEGTLAEHRDTLMRHLDSYKETMIMLSHTANTDDKVHVNNDAELFCQEINCKRPLLLHWDQWSSQPKRHGLSPDSIDYLSLPHNRDQSNVHKNAKICDADLNADKCANFAQSTSLFKKHRSKKQCNFSENGVRCNTNVHSQGRCYKHRSRKQCDYSNNSV